MSHYVISDVDLQAWVKWAKTIIPPAETETGLQELRYLLREVTDLDSLRLALGAWGETDQIDSSHRLEELTTLWQQRWQNRVPLAYLLGWAYWREFKLSVTPAVLIPRPETEYLIDLAAIFNPDPRPGEIWVDLGTGSGAIAIGLSSIFPKANIYGVDVSSAALKVAKTNIQHTQASVKLWQGSWWQPLEGLAGQITGVVSNPPYIPQAEIENLQPEVQTHEPHLALSGGADGLAAVREIIAGAKQFIRPGGVLLLEIMAGQGNAVKELLNSSQAFSETAIFPDLAGHDRYAYGRRAG